MQESKIKHFSDLLVWQKGYQLAIDIYHITKTFPTDEKFALTDQIRRASISFTSNIAEGFGRNKTNDKAHFYTMALGSLYEIESQLLIAKGLGYINIKECDTLINQCTEIAKMSTVLIKKIRSFT